MRKYFLLSAATVFALLFVYEAGRVGHARFSVEKRFADILNKKPLAVAQISDARLAQLVRIEDPNFYAHKGVDFKTPGAGVTTITQGLVKQLYFKKFRPGFAKLEQSLIARFAVDPEISKRDQLAVFLEIAYLGQCKGGPVTGFEKAALCYYETPLSALGDDQFLGLAAMLIGPNAYHPVNNSERHRERLARIKRYLADECRPSGNGDVYYEACAR